MLLYTKLFIVCVSDSKGGDQENRCFTRSKRKRGREGRGAPFQQRFVSPSKSNSVYEKAAEGVIPAKRMLVRGKGGGQEKRFFASSERKRGLEARGAPFQQLFVSPSESNSVYEKAAEGVIPTKRTLVRRYSTVRVI